MEQLGIMSLSACAKAAGHEVSLAMGSEREILSKVRDFRPQVVGFTVLTGFQRKWLRIARAIKAEAKPEPITIFGGPHPTFFPEIALEEGVDYACRGEGEGAIVELLDAVDSGNAIGARIDNLAFGEEDGLHIMEMRALQDLDALPYPDREIGFSYPFLRDDPNTHFMAGRGCPYACSFCFNRKMRDLCRGLGPYVRYRGPANLVDEIAGVHRRWGVKVAYFQDDTFVLDREWLFSFLELYAERLRLPFYCTVRADLVDRDMVRALKYAGCHRVSFGVESGVAEIRKSVLRKNLGDEKIREAASMLHEAGIPFQTTNMMGLPGERFEDALKTLTFNIDIGADIAWTSIYQPYPGTELGRRTLDEGRIDSIPDDETIADAHTASILRQEDIEKVVRLQKFAYLAVKHPRTLPWIVRMADHDHPRLYYYIHRITYLLFYFKRITKMGIRRVLKEAYVAWKYYSAN